MRLRIVLSLLLCLPGLSAASALRMEAGETRVLPVAGLTRIAVGSGQVAQAMVVDGRELIVFARKEGTTTIHVWTSGGKVLAYDLRVMPSGHARMRADVEQLLQSLPQLRVNELGEHLAIEGGGLTDHDKQRIRALAERYPAVLDMTGEVGWEQMVLLDVQVVELPRSRLHELGLNWSTTPDAASGAGWMAAAAWGGLQVQGVQAALGARLNALAQRGEAVFLAQPRLLARSGSQASFLAGGELPYQSTDAKGAATTLFKPYGVGLNITPRIDPKGTIRSRIEVESSSIDPSLTVSAGPAMRTRRASTEFNVPSGHTLVLGGFLGREYSRRQTGLPWLSDLPLLGALFSHSREETRDIELAIFVTPSIVDKEHPLLRTQQLQGQAALQQHFPQAPALFVEQPLPQNWSHPASAGSQWQVAP